MLGSAGPEPTGATCITPAPRGRHPAGRRGFKPRRSSRLPGKLSEECPRSAGASRRNCGGRGERNLLTTRFSRHGFLTHTRPAASYPAIRGPCRQNAAEVRGDRGSDMNFSASAGIGRVRRGRGPRRQVRIHSPLRGAAVGCDNWGPHWGPQLSCQPSLAGVRMGSSTANGDTNRDLALDPSAEPDPSSGTMRRVMDRYRADERHGRGSRRPGSSGLWHIPIWGILALPYTP